MAKILVTGGAGYIGSHTVLSLIESGYEVVVLDNLERGYQEAINRVEELTGQSIKLANVDLRDIEAMKATLAEHKDAQAVVHFAAYKSVGEADREPEKYFNNNVVGSLNLLSAMREAGVNKIVFSSTSAIYGDSEVLPMHERLPIKPKNAYGQSKATVEWMIQDFANAYQFSAVILRYFNAAGAHPSGQIGEDPKLSGNVIPMIMQTLVGTREQFVLYGDAFATADGTQERDYIHVMDLASGHVAAVKKLEQEEQGRHWTFNLGTGEATSNKTLMSIAQEVSGKHLSYRVEPPRQGDPLVTVSDPTLAKEGLDWKSQKSMREIIEDQWRWVSMNPEGYNLG